MNKQFIINELRAISNMLDVSTQTRHSSQTRSMLSGNAKNRLNNFVVKYSLQNKERIL